jgi:hypothetical protein
MILAVGITGFLFVALFPSGGTASRAGDGLVGCHQAPCPVIEQPARLVAGRISFDRAHRNPWERQDLLKGIGRDFSAAETDDAIWPPAPSDSAGVEATRQNR